jgi:Ferredoxin-like domain in Api92-like protein
MPNHVEHDLVVNGTKEDIEAFLKAVKGDEVPIDHNKIIPYPKKYAKLDEAAKAAHAKGDYSVKDGYNQGGYDWCIDNWGTKWGFYDFTKGKTTKSKYSDNDYTYKVSFSTAWSTAQPLFTKMAKMFPTLDFQIEYFEGGAGFAGILEYTKGRLDIEDTYEYRGRRGG